jgi:ubiquinone/menaquinone biosynthesis C-methylase UbiE
MPEIYQGPVGNHYDKFGTTNPIAQRLMAGFTQSFTELYEQVSPDTVLEIGCGEGHMLHLMQSHSSPMLHGFDVAPEILRTAQQMNPEACLSLMDGHALAYPAATFDLVVACEVLEHVFHPEQVVREAARVSKRYAIFSVPREPLWRALNFLRGQYMRDWGNTPGHIQHWSSDGFEHFIAQQFKVIAVRRPLPWTMVLCELHDVASGGTR